MSLFKKIIIFFTGGILVLCLLVACFLFCDTINHKEDFYSLQKVYYIEHVEKYICIKRLDELTGGVDIYFSKTLTPFVKDSCDASMVHMPYYELAEWDPQYFILDKSDTVVLINPSPSFSYRHNDLSFLLATNIDLIDEFFPLELYAKERHAPNGKIALTVLPDYNGIKCFDTDNNETIPEPVME